MVSGFASGTAVVEGPSLTNCTASFEEYVTQIEDIFLDYAAIFYDYAEFGVNESFDLWPYLLINDKLIWLLHSVYSVSQGCYYGGFEVYYALSDYSDWLYDPYIIMFNCINNIGFIYTNIRDIYYMIRKDTRTPIKSNYSLGLAIGQIYYFTLISSYFTQIFETINPNPITEEETVGALSGEDFVAAE